MAIERRETGTDRPGQRIVWHVAGEGEPLVLLHGGMGSWNHWIRNIEPLAREHRVLTVDMPGFGESDYPEEGQEPAHLAARLRAGLDELIGPDARFRLGAFSFGGTVVAQWLRQAPQRVIGLVLVGSSGLGVIRPGRVPLERARGLDDPKARDEAHRRNLARLMLSRLDRVDDEAVRLHAWNQARGRVQSAQHSLGDSLRQALAEVPVPLRGIWGEHDVTTPHGNGEVAEIFAQLRGSATHLDSIADAGHWVQYEAADRFNPLMLAALRELR